MGLRDLIEDKRSERAAAELSRRLGELYLSFTDRWSEHQRVVLTSDRPFLFAIGGNGAGKTTLGSWWLRSEIDGYNPITGKVRERRQPFTGYAVGNTDEKVRGVMMPALRRWLPEGYLLREDRQAGIWYFRDDARLLWKTGKQDSTTFTGDEVDAAWVDEELKDRKHWDEILGRLFRRLGRCLNTFTAAEGLLWMNHWIFSPDEYPMEEKTIARIPTDANPYYYDCDRCGAPRDWHGSKRKNVCTEFSNKDGQAKLERIKRQYKGIAYKIRVEGHALLLAGKQVISPDERERLERLHARPPVCGYLNETCTFVHVEDADDPRAWLRIQVGRNETSGKLFLLAPRPGGKYVIGADVGGGNPTGDYHAAVVIDEETGEQCALAHTRSCEPRDFGSFLCQLAAFYNNAYVVAEANNHGIAVIDRLMELGYANVYRRQRLDAVTKKPLLKVGFWTDSKSKMIAVDLMSNLFYTRFKIHDPIIYGEAYHYTWLKDDRPGCHRVGNSNPDGHDDTMTALFCAAIGLKQLGWMIVAPKDEVKVEVRRSIADELFEDSVGRSLTEEELLEGTASSSVQDQVEDTPDDPYDDDPWLP